MTNEEIASLVEQAVAAHDAKTTFMQELFLNGETILLFVGMLGTVAATVLSLVWRANSKVVSQFHEVDKRIAAVESYEETHNREDREAHGRLERGDEAVLHEVREMRLEQKASINELSQRLDESTRRGEEGRAKLHDRLEATNKEVQEVAKTCQLLVGYHEATQKAS